MKFKVFFIKFQVFFEKFQVLLLNSTYHEIREFTYLCPRGLALKNLFLTNFNFKFFFIKELCHEIGTLSIFSFFSIPKCSTSLRELLLNTVRCFVTIICKNPYGISVNVKFSHVWDSSNTSVELFKFINLHSYTFLPGIIQLKFTLAVLHGIFQILNSEV